MNIEILKDSELEIWDEFVAGNKNGSFFNTSPWLKTINQTYSFPYYCIVKKEGNAIKSGISIIETDSLIFGRKFVSNPFSLYSSIIYNNETDCREIIDFILDFAKKRDVKSIELRLYNVLPAICDLKKMNIRVVPVLNLEGSYEDTFRNYKKQFRTNIRAIIKKIEANKRFSIQIGCELKDYEDFYSVLLKLFKNKHHMLPSPYRFFVNLKNNVKNHRLYLIRYDKKAVAGIIIYLFRDKAYYAYSASDEEFDEYSVSTYLLNHIIMKLHSSGIKEMDLGVTSIQSKNLLFYKTRWGSSITNPNLYFISFNNSKFKDISAETSFIKYRKFIKYIPLSVFELMTDKLYRHLT
ncbi:MAG: GNAT family N-acetyltransferase [Candidatus Hydrogenedentota bacterium]